MTSPTAASTSRDDDAAPIPLVDLAAAHREVADEVAAGFARVLETTAFIAGPAAADFEREFAAFVGVDHCVGVANGTDALEMILRAVGIGRGDEVIIPANTFIATAEAVARAGATPVLADCDPVHLLVDPDRVVAALTPRTRAILPVHLYGQLAPMETLADIARDAGVLLLEDAAQSQGATRHGKGMGTWGVAAGTSFYPGKNLGAYGDAGAVVTMHADIASRIRLIGAHGSQIRYQHEVMGFNSRLDGLQAVVLRAKLARLADGNAHRRAAARRYDEMLAGLPGVILPATLPGNEHVWHLYVVRLNERNRALDALNSAGIGAAIHYPVPVHLHPAFAYLGGTVGDFPVAESTASEILSLPIFPEITEAQQRRVANVLESGLR